jgi:sphingomyelin phosphodiesterase
VRGARYRERKGVSGGDRSQLGEWCEVVVANLSRFYQDIFLHIIDHYPVRSGRICGLLLQSYGCPNEGVFNWSVELPGGESVERVSHKGGSFRILQLSDVHYDPNYTPYGNADCGEPVCCQGDQGEGSSVEKRCGFWTDYRDADVPWHLIEETARQVKTQVIRVKFSTD